MILFTIGLDILSQKSSITDVISHNYWRIKIDSYWHSLPLKKALSLHNVIILLKSVFNKDQNHYYYIIFQKKFSYDNINML